MSIIAGGTDALVKFLAQRELEKRQAMLDALKISDTRQQQEAEQQRIAQGARGLDIQEANQKELRRQAEQQQKNLEAERAFRRASTMYQTQQPTEDAGQAAYDLMNEQGFRGIIDRQPGISVSRPEMAAPEAKPGEIPQLPISMGRTTITPDRFPSRGGAEYQMARARSADTAAEAERARQARADENEKQRQLAIMLKGMQDSTARAIAAGRQPDPADDAALAQFVTANPGALERLTSKQFERISPYLPQGFDVRKPLLTGATNQLADFDSAFTLIDNLRTKLTDPKNVAVTGPVAGRVGALIPGSRVRSIVQPAIDLFRQRIGKMLEGGVLRKEDEIKYEKMLPLVSDPLPEQIGKINNLLQTLESDKNAFIRAHSLQGQRVPSVSGVTPGAAPADGQLDNDALDALINAARGPKK
jgi:hypothetical protein